MEAFIPLFTCMCNKYLQFMKLALQTTEQFIGGDFVSKLFFHLHTFTDIASYPSVASA